ncbi:major capsid protein [Peromfec virus RodF8_8]|uniref:Major capsid protein n=1 Tax=Peromfec virus RodF8_8 TaxID=2929389 RepID=A0A976N2N4_9VIRU|nr:major capsid protein [Peromfec virus RodF8_8]
MSNIFHVPNLTNKPSRNGFDLSHKNSFTAKIGELLPILHRTLMPGDKVRLKIQHRTVTLPLQTSAFTRFTEYFDFFFVPYSQLYRNANEVLAQTQNNPIYATSPNSASVVGTQLPWFNSHDVTGNHPLHGTGSYFQFLAGSPGAGTHTNFQGFSLACEALKLWNYLGASYVSEAWLTKPVDTLIPAAHPYSVFPWAAYQKIYFDFYRFDQWENNSPQCYNFDYLTGNLQFTNSMMRQQDSQSNLFTLRHCNYPKDLFFGVLPDSQRGEVSIANVHAYDYHPTYVPGSRLNKDDMYVEGNDESSSDTLLPVGILGDSEQNPGSGALSKVDLGIDIIELRTKKALQRYKEVVGTGNQDFRSMVKKIYGEDIPKHYSTDCQYLGGFSNIINVSTVVNNNLDSPTAQPGMKGIGVGNDTQNGEIKFEADTFGIIMCIYRVMPLLDYALIAPHFDIVKTEVDDYANPFFDRLGLQELPKMFLSDYDLDEPSEPFIGYVPRYFDYKTSVDVINGAFRTNLKSWIAVLDEDYIESFLTPGVNKDFFKVNTHLVDDIFFIASTESVNSDQFAINCNIEFKAVRNLDYDGLPKGN